MWGAVQDFVNVHRRPLTPLSPQVLLTLLFDAGGEAPTRLWTQDLEWALLETSLPLLATRLCGCQRPQSCEIWQIN